MEQYMNYIQILIYQKIWVILFRHPVLQFYIYELVDFASWYLFLPAGRISYHSHKFTSQGIKYKMFFL